MEKLRTNYVLKSRIVALSLISIMLSSSSFSVADGYTIWFEVKEINAVTTHNSNEQFYKINLKDQTLANTNDKFAGLSIPYRINLADGVSSRITEDLFEKGKPYHINLIDTISAIINSDNAQRKHQLTKENDQRDISVNIADGVGTNTTDYNKDNSKIVLIKQDDDRKALWERIFPLDRIRNGIKSFYKIIQNDHSLSYIQMDEIGSNNYDYSLEQAPIYGSELEQMLEFDKFAGKAGYVADQIGIRANNLLDVNKFVRKASFVYNQLAIHAQHYTDPEKFVGKSKFVGQQITIAVYHTVDPKQPTLLVLLVPLISFVLIRNENEKIKFYHIQKIVSYIFIVILVSSSVIAPFSYSVLYWGYAFGQEDPLGEDVGPPESIPVEEPVELPPELAEKPISETTVDETPPEQNIVSTQQTGNNLTITFNETLALDSTTTLSGIPQNYSQTLPESFSFTDDISSQLNGMMHNNPFDGITFSDDIILLLNNQMVLPEPQDLSIPLFTNGLISDLINRNYTDGSILPNATESWQFENGTSNADLIGDATINYTEGINGTSLLLDGEQDFAQTNATNSTTYITDMSIAAWVKPDYANGSPEFTVVSKGKSFALAINNLIDPRHTASFSVFDGIKWTTVNSNTEIPDDSWTHLTARFNKTAIAIYVNGTLEGTVKHSGVSYVTERGQIELKTVQEITSYHDIVIGAALRPNMDDRPYNMFSGLIDGVQLFDSRLEPEDIMQLYQTTIPIIAILPAPKPVSMPEPSLRYRIIKGNETELPVSIPAEDLNDNINQLTVSTWINPNYTGGSPEFTILGKEDSFVLSLNKLPPPEKIAKFSVFDGISWYTVSGSTPIVGWTQVAATINGSAISLYVNGTLDGKLETGPPVAGSTSNVTIGAYENNLRKEAKLSNYYSGIIQEATIWKYAMVDRQVVEEWEYYLEVYQQPTGISNGNTKEVFLSETLSILETKSILEGDS